MALTALVKDELSRLTIIKPCDRKAEVSAMLRFAGGLHIVGGRIVVEAELDTAAATSLRSTDRQAISSFSRPAACVAAPDTSYAS